MKVFVVYPFCVLKLLTYLLILSECILCVQTMNMWTSINKRAATKDKPLKRCLSPCKVFHTWCKNDGKCREKGEDCTWYCECPKNCEGFFCEKLLPDSAVEGGTVEVKVTVQKEEKKVASSFDKSKLAQALLGILKKKQITEEEKQSIAPDTIERIDNNTQISVTKNVTKHLIIQCPPESTGNKSICNCSTDSNSTPSQDANKGETVPNTVTGTQTPSTTSESASTATKGSMLSIDNSKEMAKPESTKMPDTQANTQSKIANKELPSKDGKSPSKLLEIIEHALETIPVTSEPSALKTTTVQSISISATTKSTTVDSIPDTTKQNGISVTTTTASTTSEVTTNNLKLNINNLQTTSPTVKGISISNNKNKPGEVSELYSARSVVKLTTSASADHAVVQDRSQMSNTKSSNMVDSYKSTTTVNPETTLTYALSQSTLDSGPAKEAKTQQTTTTSGKSTTIKTPITTSSKVEKSKISIKTVTENAEPKLKIKDNSHQSTPKNKDTKSTNKPTSTTNNPPTTHTATSKTTVLETKSEGSRQNDQYQSETKSMEGSGHPPPNFHQSEIAEPVSDSLTKSSTTPSTPTSTTTTTSSTTTSMKQRDNMDFKQPKKSEAQTVKPISLTKAKTMTTTTAETTSTIQPSTPSQTVKTTTSKTNPTSKVPELTNDLNQNNVDHTKETNQVEATTATGMTTIKKHPAYKTTEVKPTPSTNTTFALPSVSTQSPSPSSISTTTRSSTETVPKPELTRKIQSKEDIVDKVSTVISSTSTPTTTSTTTTTTTITPPTESFKTDKHKDIQPIVNGGMYNNFNGDNKLVNDFGDMALVSNKLPEIQKDIKIDQLKPELLGLTHSQASDMNFILK